ncbi:MAG: M55 family metallopeptidase [Bryobacteraceae bacterium]
MTKRALPLLLILALQTLPAQQTKRIFIITDAEGVAGVCRQDQTDPKDSDMRALLAGEVNAAVDGFLAGGADEVIVWDGHGGSESLSALTIHPKAKLLMGPLPATMTLERRYAAVAFVGQHSMANVRTGIMAHSYSSLGIQNMLLNGKPVGEIETRTALAGVYGTPVILLTGDQAAVDEMRAIQPATETAVVKEGIGRYTCLTLSAAAARDLIRESARKSMAKINTIKPYRIEGPVSIQIEHTTRNSLKMDAVNAAGATVIDDRTMKFSGKDFLEAWIHYRMY